MSVYDFTLDTPQQSHLFASALETPDTFEQQQIQMKRRSLPFQQNQTAASTPPISPAVAQHNLRSVAEVDERFQPVFASFQNFNFNRVQSEVLPYVLHGDSDLVLSAPTGSGKTGVLEMCLVRLFSQAARGSVKPKAVYISPIRALCCERQRDWEGKFSRLGFKCGEFTGDVENAFSTGDLEKYDIIITTPEKWDSITRKWRKNDRIIDSVSLLMMDEVHLLNDTRGATLEVVVSRMKAFTEGSHHQIRFVAVSATVPNIYDIGQWLGNNTIVQQFGEEYRPVLLDKRVMGFSGNDNYHAFDTLLNSKLYGVIDRYSKGKPSLVFCNTRKSTVASCQAMMKEIQQRQPGTPSHPFVKSFNEANELAAKSDIVDNKDLKEFIRNGVAFHHAGLSGKDKKVVEDLFLQSKVKVVATTSTLACGVNFPAHLVVIKGTKMYVDNELVDYSPLDILQMVGRAGRPQFDDSGVSVIMCHSDESQKYHALIKGSQTIESHLHNHLIEHINSEIGIGTITNLESAVRWIKSTFLSIRMEKNPSYYKMTSGNVYQELENYCRNAIDSLLKNGFIEYANGGKLIQTAVGSTMSTYYIKYQSMIRIAEMKKESSIGAVLMVVCESGEFENTRLNPGERQILNDANARIKYQLDGKVTTTAHKLYVLIQCSLGSVSLGQFANGNKQLASGLESEVKRSFQIASRILKCVMAYCYSQKDAVSLLNAVELVKSLNVGNWDADPESILRQLPKIGQALAKNLSANGIKSIADLVRCEPRRIEIYCKRNSPFGNEVIDVAKRIPKISLKLTKFEPSPPTGFIEISVEIANVSQLEIKRNMFKIGSPFLFFVAYSKDGKFFDYRRLPLMKMYKNGTVFTLKVPEMLDLNVKVVCDSFLGCDESAELQLLDSSAFIDSITPTLPEKSVSATIAPVLKQTKIDEFSFKPANPTELIRDASENYMRVNPKISNDDHSAEPTSKNELTANTCDHKCKDKLACKHQCCKEGRVGAKRKRSKIEISPFVDELAAVGDGALNEIPMDFDMDLSFPEDDLPTVQESMRFETSTVTDRPKIAKTNLNHILGEFTTKYPRPSINSPKPSLKQYKYSPENKLTSPVIRKIPQNTSSPVLTPIERMQSVAKPTAIISNIEKAKPRQEMKWDWSKHQNKLGENDADYFMEGDDETINQNSFQQDMIDMTFAYM